MPNEEQVDPRVQPFARFMQQRDARIYETQGLDGNFQSWDEIGEMGREEYTKDAVAYLAAVDVIEANIAKNNDPLPLLWCGRWLKHPKHEWVSGASGNAFICDGK